MSIFCRESIKAGIFTQISPSYSQTYLEGYRVHVDSFDGYSFIYPDTWVMITTPGYDVFYRNPADPSENLFVEFSSLSTSKFASIRDLGSPKNAAQIYLNQQLRELMSLRLGIRRDAKIFSASSRNGLEGREYYDFEIGIRSYASRQQLAITQAERFQELEWERRFICTLGTANGRLYELRIQTPAYKRLASQTSLLRIRNSFECLEISSNNPDTSGTSFSS